MPELFITFSNTTFMLTYVIFGFGVNFVIQKYGLGIGVSSLMQVWCGVILTAVGMWIKSLTFVTPWAYMIGNTFGGLGQPFYLNANALVSATWFPDHHVSLNYWQRVMATTFASMANNIGNVFGSLFPTYFFSDDENPSAEVRSDN